MVSILHSLDEVSYRLSLTNVYPHLKSKYTSDRSNRLLTRGQKINTVAASDCCLNRSKMDYIVQKSIQCRMISLSFGQKRRVSKQSPSICIRPFLIVLVSS